MCRSAKHVEREYQTERSRVIERSVQLGPFCAVDAVHVLRRTNPGHIESVGLATDNLG